MRRIYMDHSATTPVDPEIAQAMVKYMTEDFGNPSSIHAFGREARKAVEEARERVAKAIGANPQEIIFTSGGTEADNMAILGVAQANCKKGNHIITSSVEHHAVLDTCKHLEKNGYSVTYLPVDEYGRVRVEDVEKAITKNTILITIMHANNEVGTIQPIAEIGQLAKKHGVLFHVDAVQSFGKIPVNVDELQVDLLSLSSHKIYGPKGVGALYIRRGTRITPITHGGAQERKRRAGTENVPGIVGFGLAAEKIVAEMAEESPRLQALRDKLIKGIMEKMDYVKLNGHPTERLPHNVNFSFHFIEGESLLLMLDMKGIAASSGSACTSGSLDPSHVLLAMGLSHEVAHGSLRLTLGKVNTEEDVDYVLEELPKIVQRLREMSPLGPGVTIEAKECYHHVH
ncbi:MAG: cysteine desulfurase NifS [Bacillota bacterium]|uniref:Cysteine desulfurase IscS n=2 Tax=Carboxydocella TaxID=178898 RepID=A0A1T4PTD5_9FIRM|nr:MULTISPECIES: cysteine desulfurase NifS [Carboxydocella]AVX19678.1 cysteine desulfurase [Carboxydocella thermautotrophica]AVX30083.1 cysteine desulfurase [Carboxydocella thermautotrophica]SJZ94168.1 cysteine desulfurase [Carboxydocella sporoproducens DSM 16521]GAW29540.1 cysteine desulfurase NifS [Carboxydocella sp. ULO1]GAW31326.1 cysteine desulfurase NifS [Carboxydocella sp. JDF658]